MTARPQNLHTTSVDAQRVLLGNHLRMAGNDAFMKNDADKAAMLYKVDLVTVVLFGDRLTPVART